MKKTLEIFEAKRSLISSSLKKTMQEYRFKDPGWYLYNILCREKNINNKFKEDFIELSYATLCAWNMNSRGAKLAEWEIFKESIIKSENLITSISKHNLITINENALKEILKTEISDFFKNITLVASDKPRLITYSKLLHFYLPNLFVPIDRKYTLTFFYGHTNVAKKIELQIAKFSELMLEFKRFASKIDLNSNKDKTWNLSTPKIIDNIIIGYQKLKEKNEN